ncbi:hypothetical protein PHLCEN_2v10261 [Hermanssonia centrifuga]|uniref:Cyclin N-terminal domain-containing protein n=1 Tax=Hermanssonia centrifuga TaxID=98765 RepID=A0A2R6NNC7_9APHY|nr:hypothetical protein PHLCEN_2v10261 [Hermanssonia centrifuga]
MAPKERPRIDGASLVDPALHSPALMELLNTELSRTLIEYIVDRVVDVVDYALGRPSTSTRGRSSSRRSAHAEFSGFARTVIERAGVQLPVLLGTLVYLDRARPHLQLSLEEWACERVFLGALICANKNVHWSLCTGLFNKRDVGRIEREFLDVLDFELQISEADILVHHDAIVALKISRSRPHLRISLTGSSTARPPVPARRTSNASDSSMDVEEDSPSTSDSLSLPRTPPAVPMDLDHTGYVHHSAKHSPDEQPTTNAAAVRLSAPETPIKPRGDAAAYSQKDHRLSSAFNLLRNIHVPHFHSTSSSS